MALDSSGSRRVVDVFESDPTVGIVGMRQCFTDDAEAPRPVDQGRKEVGGFSGGRAAFRRAMLDKTGHYPEDFFLLAEETFLTILALEAGYRIVFDPNIIMWHPRQAVTAGTRWDYYRFRNALLVVTRLFPGWLMGKYLILRIASHAMYSLQRRTLHRYLRAVAYVLLHLPGTLVNRRPCSAKAVRKYFLLR